MGRRADGRTAGLSLLAAVLLTARPPACLSAQLAPNRATAYLHPTDVRDARALWVNPAGLGVLREASVYAELAIDQPGAQGRLRQVDAGFNARGLSFGYQRDVFDGGERGHTYRLGLAGNADNLAAGFAVTQYRGTNTSPVTGWDAGVVYAWRPSLTVGGVIANIGQPSVRGVEQRVTFVPGVTWRPRGLAALSAHARITTDSVLSYAFGLSWLGTGRLPIGVLARLDTDGGFRRGAFSFGISIGGPDRVGVVASTPGDASRIETVSLYGVSSRRPVGRGR
jgi:hypothetical protein